MVVPISAAAFYFRRVGSGASYPLTVRSLSGSRSSTTSIKLFSDGVLDSSNTALDSGSVVPALWAHGGLLSGSTALSDGSNYTAQVETVGSNLSDTEHLTLFNIAATFCSSLGRT